MYGTTYWRRKLDWTVGWPPKAILPMRFEMICRAGWWVVWAAQEMIEQERRVCCGVAGVSEGWAFPAEFLTNWSIFSDADDALPVLSATCGWTVSSTSTLDSGTSSLAWAGVRGGAVWCWCQGTCCHRQRQVRVLTAGTHGVFQTARVAGNHTSRDA